MGRSRITIGAVCDIWFTTVAVTGNFASGQDVLGFTTVAGISGAYNGGTGVLTLTGSASVAAYQTVLQSVTYFNNSNDPSGATEAILGLGAAQVGCTLR